MIHILILDELYQGFEDQVSFSDFISDSDNVKLLLITSRGGVSPKDKEKCLAYAEIAQPSTNGLMEKIAIEFHTKYRIDRIYVNQEEFIVRAAVLRKHFNLSNGLSVSESLLFRDKVSMKALATKHGIPTPNFAKVYTPTDIITFCKENKFPVIIKPTLSCASVGITVLHNSDELDKYLENDYFARQSYATMDTYGDLIIEKFVPSTMFHINGYAEKGQLMYVWPFQYKNTNLDFIDGNEYGNISIPQNDPLYKKLIAFTQKILSVFPQPPNLIFHLELFQNDSGDFMLCEIAARKPEGGKQLFPEIEFRLNCGLNSRQDINCKVELNKYKENCVGDLLIRRPIGKLIHLPDPKECPIANLKCIKMATENTTYSGYDVNIINTSMRMICLDTGKCPVLETLAKGSDWYRKNVQYSQA